MNTRHPWRVEIQYIGDMTAHSIFLTFPSEELATPVYEEVRALIDGHQAFRNELPKTIEVRDDMARVTLIAKDIRAVIIIQGDRADELTADRNRQYKLEAQKADV